MAAKPEYIALKATKNDKTTFFIQPIITNTLLKYYLQEFVVWQ
jgi:hypothetical protein